jgi:hypothetical protein
MRQGTSIFPHEGISELMDIFDQIKSTTVFAESSFDYAYEKSKIYFPDKQECRKNLIESHMLGSAKIIIGDNHPYHLSRQRRRMIDRKYKEFSIEKDYGIEISSRLVYV